MLVAARLHCRRRLQHVGFIGGAKRCACGALGRRGLVASGTTGGVGESLVRRVVCHEQVLCRGRWLRRRTGSTGHDHPVARGEMERHSMVGSDNSDRSSGIQRRPQFAQLGLVRVDNHMHRRGRPVGQRSPCRAMDPHVRGDACARVCRRNTDGMGRRSGTWADRRTRDGLGRQRRADRPAAASQEPVRVCARPCDRDYGRHHSTLRDAKPARSLPRVPPPLPSDSPRLGHVHRGPRRCPHPRNIRRSP